MKINYYLLIGISILILVACQKENLFDESSDISNITNLYTRVDPWWGSPLSRTDSSILMSAFPNLSLSELRVISGPDVSYNCIAYSMGVYDQWINPPRNYLVYQELYANAKKTYGASYNYLMCPISFDMGVIDAYGGGLENMTHASRRYIGRDYASKLGAYSVITHPRDANFGTLYGYVLFSLFEDITNNNLKGIVDLEKKIEIKISTSEEVFIRKFAQITSANRVLFEELFEQWIQNWKTNPITMFSNSTYDARKLKEYPQLLAMGNEIIPLVIEKLLDVNNFVGLVLYDELQNNEFCKVVYKKNDPKIFEGEQKRSLRTIKLWLSANNFES